MIYERIMHILVNRDLLIPKEWFYYVLFRLTAPHTLDDINENLIALKQFGKIINGTY
jgi:hypothetical protein